MLSERAKKARRDYNRRWKEKNRERHRQYMKKYMKKWRQENPEKLRQYEERYWEKKAAGAEQEGSGDQIH